LHDRRRDHLARIRALHLPTDLPVDASRGLVDRVCWPRDRELAELAAQPDRPDASGGLQRPREAQQELRHVREPRQLRHVRDRRDGGAGAARLRGSGRAAQLRRCRSPHGACRLRQEGLRGRGKALEARNAEGARCGPAGRRRAGILPRQRGQRRRPDARGPRLQLPPDQEETRSGHGACARGPALQHPRWRATPHDSTHDPGGDSPCGEHDSAGRGRLWASEHEPPPGPQSHRSRGSTVHGHPERPAMLGLLGRPLPRAQDRDVELPYARAPGNPPTVAAACGAQAQGTEPKRTQGGIFERMLAFETLFEVLERDQTIV
ncbi:MAG: hypothetical protein UU07_C0023G0001, partial [Parcubacteria group bacterium GW2011_GWF1_40_5]